MREKVGEGGMKNGGMGKKGWIFAGEIVCAVQHNPEKVLHLLPLL